MPDRVILTGFRATGKSSVGARLAERLGFDCVDTDAELGAEIRSSIAEFVQRHGWSAFRQKEKELLAKLAGRTKVVIATGGGAILHQDEWRALRKNSLVVWLKADADTIRRRLRQDLESAGQRPSLTGMRSDEEVDTLLQARDPLYREGSDVSVDTAVLAPDEIVTTIVREISAENPG